MVAVCVLVLLAGWSGWSRAASTGKASLAGEVRVGPRTALVFETNVAGISAAERADIVNRRVQRILEDPTIDPSQIEARFPPDGGAEIAVGDFVITGVTPGDALAAGLEREELTEMWARSLRAEITQLQPLYLRRGKIDVKMLSEHRVLLLVLQVALLLLVARVCGEIMARLGQPPVIGQLLAGIVLGQSVLGALVPDLHALVFPVESTQSYLLEVVSWIGVIFLLMLTGMETDLALVRKQGKPAIWASLSGIVIPFAFGFGAIWLLPEGLLILPDQRLIMGLFLGTALSISSVPVIAKILMDMKLMRRDVGQVILASAIADDTLGWIILAMVAGLAASGAFSAAVLLKALVGTALFIAFSLTLGRRATFAILRWVNDHAATQYALLTAVVILMLFSASITQFIGVHAVLGAFIFGVVLNTSPLVGRKVIEPLEAITNGVFAPIFFAAAGLYVNLGVMFTPSLLVITLLLTGAACAGKIVGCYGGGRLGGLGKWEALSLGLGMNARGAMGLIIAILGFSLGLLTVDLFSIIVVMALLTTAMTPPLLRWSLSHVTPGEEEQTRLDQEEKQAVSFLGQIRRVLLPTRGSDDAALASQLLGAVAQNQPLEVTAIHISSSPVAAGSGSASNGSANSGSANSSGAGNGNANGGEGRSGAIFSHIIAALKNTKATLVKRTIQSDDPAKAILREAEHGYDLLTIGCGKVSASPEALFGRIADEVAMESPDPLLVVHAGEGVSGALRHILVLATGVEHSQRAIELAIGIARATGAKVSALHIVEQQNELLSRVVRQRARSQEAAHEAVGFATKLGESFKVPVEAVVRRSKHAAPEIVRYAQENEVDIILLSGSFRPSRHVFMGPTVTYVLNHAPCAVAVLKPQNSANRAQRSKK